MSLLHRLVPDRFLLLLVAAVALATALPARGPLAPILSAVSIATVVLLFFFHGARLAREQIVAGATHWRLHLAILGSTFVMFPIVGIVMRQALGDRLPPALAIGIVFF